MNTIYVIIGQTATGKTKYALNLASKINGELINFDSRQIYKKLDVITGKDLDKTDRQFELRDHIGPFDIGSYTFEELDVPIWLYDIVDPKLSFSSFDYRECAMKGIHDMLDRNKSPIFVGGTYFYIKHVLYGTIETRVEPNPTLRKELITKSVSELQQLLKNLDQNLFESLNNSEKNNPHRLIRKIEILKSNKINNVQQPKLSELFPNMQIKMIGFEHSSKDSLQDVIAKRVEDRLQRGAIQEVETLLHLGYTKDDPGLKTIGYIQIISYLKKIFSFEEMREQWITKEVQYAKRQLTFMKKDPHIIWKISEEK